MRQWLRILVIVAVLGAVIVWFARYRLASTQEGDPRTLKFATVERGDLLVTVAATGTLEPEELVDVGAQVAGKIQELGREPSSGRMIDYGSVVEPETVLARIDPAIYEQEVNFARAQLNKAKAKLKQTEAQTVEASAAVERAIADLVQLRVRFRLAKLEFDRAERLFPTKSITEEDYDTAQSNLDAAKAACDVGDASLKQAESAVTTAKATEEESGADVESADASLKRAEKNLDYTTIRSPIKGVIVDRRVNVGQTVVASLNAPSLFLIAKDLSRLQVWASVNEADIGRLSHGQAVTFTVDTFPGEIFAGKVQQIRLNASMTQNVVTYTVVVEVDNAQNKLIPYLTANVKFEVAKLTDVLLLPNAALRWKPRAELIAPEFRDRKPAKNAVWVRQGDYVRPLAIKVVDTDGTMSAVEAASGTPVDESADANATKLSEGMGVVIGEAAEGPKEEMVNPLLPQRQGKKKKS
jgi:HlyD family secretion protein